MKRIVGIVLISFLSLMVLTGGVYAKPSSAAPVDEPVTENSQQLEELQNETLTDEENEQGEADGTANQAKNYVQKKKLEECIKVRGMNMKFDVPPVIKEGRTLIPIRAIMNGLGADVQWDQETNAVTITRDNVTIVLNLTTGETTVDGESITLDVPAQLISNRTFVPLRFIAQSLGEKVNYDEETGDIDIGEDAEEDIDDEDSEAEDADEENTDEENTDEENTDEENAQE